MGTNGDAMTLVEGIRLRPSMYIGSTDSCGIHLLIETLIENGVNAHRHGGTRRIEITLPDDASVTVEYDGDGVSIAPEAVFDGRSYLEVAFTELFAGGCTTKAAYDRRSRHGLGVWVVPPLSEICEVETFIAGEAWRIRFHRGMNVEPLTRVGTTTKSGLRVRCQIDPTIFETARIDGLELRRRVRELAALEPRLTIGFCDEVLGHADTFHFPHGIRVLLQDLFSAQGILPEPLVVEDHANRNRLSFAVQYLAGNDTEVRSFANTDCTRQGGVHVRGCLLGLRDALRAIARSRGSEIASELTLDRVSRGLRAVVAIDLPGAQFEGPTKDKLANADIERWCRQVVALALTQRLEKSQAQAARLLQHLKLRPEPR